VGLEAQVRRRGTGALKRVARRCGVEVVRRGRYDVVRHDVYSPVPDLAGLPPDLWDRRDPLAGIALDVDAALRLVETELAPFVEEFDFPRDGPQPPGAFFLFNDNFEAVDSELLYALVRARKPRRVVELGSGYTSLLIAEACRRNAADDTRTVHVAYDPYPRPQVLGARVPEPTVVVPISAADVPLEVFTSLQANDILFVDTTHTVKVGSEVVHVVLDVLPLLRAGVLVHFHDIFLPWPYPREWLEQHQWYWAEQFLLQGFLAFNEGFELLLPAQAMARDRPERLGAAIPSFVPGAGVGPASLWLVRR
jgi:predicted O-methyltransferase YrrM